MLYCWKVQEFYLVTSQSYGPSLIEMLQLFTRGLLFLIQRLKFQRTEVSKIANSIYHDLCPWYKWVWTAVKRSEEKENSCLIRAVIFSKSKNLPAKSLSLNLDSQKLSNTKRQLKEKKKNQNQPDRDKDIRNGRSSEAFTFIKVLVPFQFSEQTFAQWANWADLVISK